MDNISSLSPSLDNDSNSTEGQQLENKQTIQEFVLAQYCGTRPIYSLKDGFLLGLPRDLEHLQAKLISQTVQAKANKFELLNESFEDDSVSSRSLASFSLETLKKASNKRLTLRERITNYCILNGAYLASIAIFLCILFITGLDLSLIHI